MMSPILLKLVVLVVIMMSSVCPLLWVGILTCCVRSKAFIESISMHAFWLLWSSMCMFIFPIIIILLCLAWIDFRRSVSWSMNIESIEF